MILQALAIAVIAVVVGLAALLAFGFWIAVRQDREMLFRRGLCQRHIQIEIERRRKAVERA